MRRSEAPVGLRPLIPEDRLRARVRALARRIRTDYRGRELHLVGILKGAFIFMADLIRQIPHPVSCDFLALSSYGSGTESRGTVRFNGGLSQPLRGRDVLVVEDIVDTGLTLRTLLKALRAGKPRSLRVCALLHKPARSRGAVRIDYLGFRIPDRFVVGYGLDHAGRYRNLPYLASLDEGK